MIKQTALYPVHLRLKAKMVDFQGWQMPLLYSDTQEEYQAVRSTAGLFDVSHLGRIEVSGAGAAALLQKVFTRNVEKLVEGAAAYGLICNDAGSILDDVLLYRLPAEQSPSSASPAERRYLISTNAANTENILAWLKRHAGQDVRIADTTQTTVQVALQGPRSLHILEALTSHHFRKIKLRAARAVLLLDTSVLVSRTGYTGEHGYELFAPANLAESLWDAIMNAGKEIGVVPCGIGSRDILRLERGLPMYGNELDETRTPLEAGLGAFVDFKKDFIGKDALLKLKTEGVKQKLIGFTLLDKSIPRSGGSIFSENREIGTVTSGALSPYLRKGIGLGYVVSRYAQPGQEIEIEIRDKEIAAKIVDLPFYKKK